MEKIHEGLLVSLFECQRREHPVVTSISELVLDASFGFPEPYDIYIKVVQTSTRSVCVLADPSYFRITQSQRAGTGKS